MSDSDKEKYHNEEETTPEDEDRKPAPKQPYITRSELNKNDCLFGRGNPSVRNEGNIRLRKLVSEHQEEYLTADRPEDKSRIARNIIEIVEGQNGRFLRRLDPTSQEAKNLGVQLGTQAWVPVRDEAVVLEKVKQTFRDIINLGAKKEQSERGDGSILTALGKRQRSDCEDVSGYAQISTAVTAQQTMGNLNQFGGLLVQQPQQLSAPTSNQKHEFSVAQPDHLSAQSSATTGQVALLPESILIAALCQMVVILQNMLGLSQQNTQPESLSHTKGNPPLVTSLTITNTPEEKRYSIGSQQASHQQIHPTEESDSHLNRPSPALPGRVGPTAPDATAASTMHDASDVNRPANTVGENVDLVLLKRELCKILGLDQGTNDTGQIAGARTATNQNQRVNKDQGCTDAKIMSTKTSQPSTLGEQERGNKAVGSAIQRCNSETLVVDQRTKATSAEPEGMVIHPKMNQTDANLLRPELSEFLTLSPSTNNAAAPVDNIQISNLQSNSVSDSSPAPANSSSVPNDPVLAQVMALFGAYQQLSNSTSSKQENGDKD